MNKIDGRKLTKEQQEYVRIRAGELLKTKKYSKEEISEMLGISRELVRQCECKIRKNGIKLFPGCVTLGGNTKTSCSE